MLAVDSSVVVAAFASWHERHDLATSALDERPSAPAHALLESYSVLTRLPAPMRAPGSVVRDFLAREFPVPARLALAEDEQAVLVERLDDLGIEGGAAYDALIALIAGAADAKLLTLDRRALGTYLRCAVDAAVLSA